MTPWVRRLIVANAVAFVLTWYLFPALLNLFAFVPALVLVRPWTPITYMFLHGGFWHIFFNMLGLYYFGMRTEVRLGAKRFLWLYFVSGLTGALLSFLLAPQAPIIGASAAVMGVSVAYARYWPNDQFLLWGVLPVSARMLVIGNAVASIFFATSNLVPGIAHFAHLGGLAGGWLFLVWSDRHSPAAQFKARAAPAAARRPVAFEDVRRWSTIRRDNMHPINRDELDRILAKIEAQGAASLSVDERAFLDRFST